MYYPGSLMLAEFRNAKSPETLCGYMPAREEEINDTKFQEELDISRSFTVWGHSEMAVSRCT